MTPAEKGELKRLVDFRRDGKVFECIDATTDALAQPAHMSTLMRRSLLGLRSDCYLDSEQWEAAIRDLDALLAERVEAPLLSNRALALWNLGDLESAFQGFAAALQVDPSEQVTLRNMGRLQLERGDHVGGFSCLRTAAELGPSEPLNHLFLADALVQAGEYAEAFAEYVRVLEIDRRNVRAREQLSRLERLLDETEEEA